MCVAVRCRFGGAAQRQAIVELVLGCRSSSYLGDSDVQRALLTMLAKHGFDLDTPILACTADSAGPELRGDLKFLHPIHAVAQ